MENRTELMRKHLDDFTRHARYLLWWGLRAQDAEQPLAYLAVRAFEKDPDKYEKWLTANHVNIGTMTPLQVLESDTESWVVRKELLLICLRREGLWIEAPEITPVCEQVQTPTGPAWVPIVETKRANTSAQA